MRLTGAGGPVQAWYRADPAGSGGSREPSRPAPVRPPVVLDAASVRCPRPLGERLAEGRRPAPGGGDDYQPLLGRTYAHPGVRGGAARRGPHGGECLLEPGDAAGHVLSDAALHHPGHGLGSPCPHAVLLRLRVPGPPDGGGGAAGDGPAVHLVAGGPGGGLRPDELVGVGDIAGPCGGHRRILGVHPGGGHRHPRGHHGAGDRGGRAGLPGGGARDRLPSHPLLGVLAAGGRGDAAGYPGRHAGVGPRDPRPGPLVQDRRRVPRPLPGVGALGRRGDREPHELPVVAVLPLTAGVPVVADRPHGHARRLRAPRFGQPGVGAAPGPALPPDGDELRPGPGPDGEHRGQRRPIADHRHPAHL